MLGEKVLVTGNDIKYYEKRFKQVVSFSQEYLRNQELMLSVSDYNQVKTCITASKNRMSFVSKITESSILDRVA